MDIYLCDHCHIEFGCDSANVVCSHCGAEQTPPAYKIQPMEHAILGPQETAVRKTKPVPHPGVVRRLGRAFGRKK